MHREWLSMLESLKRYEGLNMEAFVVVNKMFQNKYKTLMKNFPFKTRFVDPSTPKGKDFTHEMISLNEKAYGKGMAAPAWTFSNFGTIGAGITAGFLSNNVPISKLSLVGNISDPTIAHEWTLLVDPDFEGKGIGSVTFALALHLAQDKDFLTFIIQTNNASSNIYLKNIYPLNILSYGFVHTCNNSLFIKTKIPKDNPFQTLLDNELPAYKLEDFEIATHDIPLEPKTFWIRDDNHALYQNLNENINHGHKYILKAKTQKADFIYFLIESE
jgi:GNAT superfamily N-acetyltransferase